MNWVIFVVISIIHLGLNLLFFFDDELFETLFWIFKKCFEDIECGTPIFLNLDSKLQDIQKVIAFVEHMFLYFFRFLIQGVSIIENFLNTNDLLIIGFIIINIMFPKNGIFLHRTFFKLYFIVTRSFNCSSRHKIINNLNFKIQ